MVSPLAGDSAGPTREHAHEVNVLTTEVNKREERELESARTQVNEKIRAFCLTGNRGRASGVVVELKAERLSNHHESLQKEFNFAITKGISALRFK